MSDVQQSHLELLFEKFKKANPAIEDFMRKMYESDADPIELAIFLHILSGHQIQRAVIDSGVSEGDIDLIQRVYLEEYNETMSKDKPPLISTIIGTHKTLGVSLLTFEHIQNMISQGDELNERNEKSSKSANE